MSGRDTSRAISIPDFSRIGRQQQFLRAVLNRLLSPERGREGTIR